MPLELALAEEQAQREEQGRIALENRESEEIEDCDGFNPSTFEISSAPYFPNVCLASHPDYPETACGQGSSPSAAIQNWIDQHLCPCGMKCAEDCDCPF
ncbi:MAG: hypothetical protein WCD18_28185 [Thermosynechococcaceae cyanobacterium]